MARCPYDQLRDVEDVLAVIRTRPEINEPKLGIFCLRRTPFLHFHLQGDRRWADVRDGTEWGASLDIPPRASVAAKRRFLRVVAGYHRSTWNALLGRRARLRTR